MRGTARRLILTLALAAAPAAAKAQGLDLTGVGARAIGRAGAAVVSSDDGAALWYNPSGLARRSELRAQAGLALADQAMSYQSNHAFNAGAVGVEDRAGAELVGWVGAQAGLGDRVVVALGYLAPTALSFGSATSTALFPATEDDFRYPQRHAASRFRLLRRGIGAGVAVRLLPWLAVGASALAFDAQLFETRTVLGGYARLEEDFRSPNGDMAVRVSGRDRFVPAGTLGLIAAPEDTPIEIAASLTWCDAADLTGSVEVDDSRGARPDAATYDPYATASVAPGDAALDLRFPLVARAGVRFLTSRVALELAGEIGRLQQRRLDWTLTGVDITCEEVAGDPATAAPRCPSTRALTSMPVATRLRTGYALRAAVEATAFDGFLTFTGGYAFAKAIVPRTALSTAFPDLDSHTVALGVEAHVEGATISLGAARSERLARTVRPEDSETLLVAPFSDQEMRVGGGRYDGAATVIGLGVEMELR